MLYKIRSNVLAVDGTSHVCVDITYDEQSGIKMISRIKTTGVSEIKCKRVPASRNYGFRWKACNICSFVIYVIAFYIYIAVGLAGGTVEFGFGLVIVLALLLIMSVYITVSVLKKKSIFDVTEKTDVVWEKN